MKTCRICKDSLPLDDFGNNTRYADGKHFACRLCWNDYINTRRWANGTKPEEPFLIRLWNSVQQCEHGEICLYCCWSWLKIHDEDGYGKFSTTNAAGRHLMHPVTRILWEIWHTQPIPHGLIVCHFCDNPSCVNPTHFWLGTLNDNRQDCVAKGRQAQGLTHKSKTHPEAIPHGEAHHKAKLTETQVLEIRFLATKGVVSRKLAAQFGVSKFAILQIIRRRSWAHI
jgi:hypothetical protein